MDYDTANGTKHAKSGSGVQIMAAAAVANGESSSHNAFLVNYDKEHDTKHTKSASGITAGMSEAFLEELGKTYRLVVYTDSSPPAEFSVSMGAKEAASRSQARGLQRLSINDKLAILRDLVLEKGGDQSFRCGPSVVRLVRHGDPLPDLNTFPRLSTAIPSDWNRIPVAGSMPFGSNDDHEGKSDGVKCGNIRTSRLTSLAENEFNTFHKALAPHYRTQKLLSDGNSVFLVYCRAFPTPMIFHCEERLKQVLKVWTVSKSIGDYITRRFPRPTVAVWNKGEVVVFHSEGP